MGLEVIKLYITPMVNMFNKQIKRQNLKTKLEGIQLSLFDYATHQEGIWGMRHVVSHIFRFGIRWT
jgi:hypothetical protein